MSLCSICTKLDIKDFTDWDNDVQDVTHIDSLWTLKVTSETCQLCSLLFNEFAKHNSFKHPRPGEKSSPIILRAAQHFDEDWNVGGIYLIRARCDSLGIKAWIGLYPEEGEQERLELISDTI